MASNPRAFIFSDTFPIAPATMFDVWTSPEHLRHWFGPAGVSIVRHTMDLRPGGQYHFCLKSPDGQLMWGKWAFVEVSPPQRLVWLHAFSDESGKLTRHPMSPTWPLQLRTTVTFEEEGNQTRVTLRWEPHAATEAEKQTFDSSHDSMRQGWGGTFGQLRAYVAGLAGTASKPMDPVVHFELPYENRERMATFYRGAFGWETTLLGPEMGNYVLATTARPGADGSPAPGTINGGFYPKRAEWPAQFPSVVIAVADIRAAIHAVSDAGGQVLGEPMAIPGVGQYVSFFDTEGNRNSMLEALPREPSTPKTS